MKTKLNKKAVSIGNLLLVFTLISIIMVIFIFGLNRDLASPNIPTKFEKIVESYSNYNTLDYSLTDAAKKSLKYAHYDFFRNAGLNNNNNNNNNNLDQYLGFNRMSYVKDNTIEYNEPEKSSISKYMSNYFNLFISKLSPKYEEHIFMTPEFTATFNKNNIHLFSSNGISIPIYSKAFTKQEFSTLYSVIGTPYDKINYDSGNEKITFSNPIFLSSYQFDQWPTSGKVINSCFGYRNINTGSKCHGGIDIDGEQGDPVFAIEDGIVESLFKAYSTSTQFDSMLIRHPNGLYTRYLHIIPLVSKSQSVKKGDAIAKIADYKHGDHLHFEIDYKKLDVSGYSDDQICDANDIKKSALVRNNPNGLYGVDPLCYFSPDISYTFSSSSNCIYNSEAIKDRCTKYKFDVEKLDKRIKFVLPEDLKNNIDFNQLKPQLSFNDINFDFSYNKEDSYDHTIIIKLSEDPYSAVYSLEQSVQFNVYTDFLCNSLVQSSLTIPSACKNDIFKSGIPTNDSDINKISIVSINLDKLNENYDLNHLLRMIDKSLYFMYKNVEKQVTTAKLDESIQPQQLQTKSEQTDARKVDIGTITKETQNFDVPQFPYGDAKCELTNPQPTSKKEFIQACQKYMSEKKICTNSIFENECESFWIGAQKGQVNPYFLFSLAVHEGRCGTSRIAQDKKNTYGWGAIDSNPYGGAKKFTEMNWLQINSYISSEIHRRWLAENPKWNPKRITLAEISGPTATGPVYATHDGWAPGIANLMSNLMNVKCLAGDGIDREKFYSGVSQYFTSKKQQKIDKSKLSLNMFSDAYSSLFLRYNYNFKLDYDFNEFDKLINNAIDKSKECSSEINDDECFSEYVKINYSDNFDLKITKIPSPHTAQSEESNQFIKSLYENKLHYESAKVLSDIINCYNSNDYFCNCEIRSPNIFTISTSKNKISFAYQSIPAEFNEIDLSKTDLLKINYTYNLSDFELDYLLLSNTLVGKTDFKERYVLTRGTNRIYRFYDKEFLFAPSLEAIYGYENLMPNKCSISDGTYLLSKSIDYPLLYQTPEYKVEYNPLLIFSMNLLNEYDMPAPEFELINYPKSQGSVILALKESKYKDIELYNIYVDDKLYTIFNTSKIKEYYDNNKLKGITSFNDVELKNSAYYNAKEFDLSRKEFLDAKLQFKNEMYTLSNAENNEFNIDDLKIILVINGLKDNENHNIKVEAINSRGTKTTSEKSIVPEDDLAPSKPNLELSGSLLNVKLNEFTENKFTKDDNKKIVEIRLIESVGCSINDYDEFSEPVKIETSGVEITYDLMQQTDFVKNNLLLEGFDVSPNDLCAYVTIKDKFGNPKPENYDNIDNYNTLISSIKVPSSIFNIPVIE